MTMTTRGDTRGLRIGFVGGGNMAAAIVGGLLQAGHPASDMCVCEPSAETRGRLAAQFPGVLVSAGNNDAVANASYSSSSSSTKTTKKDDEQKNLISADIVILAVKPQAMQAVAEALAPAVVAHGPVVLSIAAGVAVPSLARWLAGASVVRCMPNTPALVLQGATGLYAPPSVSQAHRAMADAVVRSFSKRSYWVESESLLDVVTGVSGSGPAYFFLLVECLEAAGVQLGLPLDVARGLATQTCLGAGHMLASTNEDPAELRRKVTSPKGTTEAAINSLESSGIRAALMDAVRRATERGAELGVLMGQQ